MQWCYKLHLAVDNYWYHLTADNLNLEAYNLHFAENTRCNQHNNQTKTLITVFFQEFIAVNEPGRHLPYSSLEFFTLLTPGS